MDILESRVADNATAAEPLVRALAEEFAGPSREISVACDSGLRLEPEHLDAFAGIVREALANATAHAFSAGRSGRIWITLAQEGDRYRLKVADNGPGYPKLDDCPHPGLDLIEHLAQSLGGYCRLDNRNYGGAEVTVVFPRSAAG